MPHNTLTEHPIYGTSRLGVYKRKSKTTRYQLTDHLGNVRAVIAKKGSNAAALVAKTDYYPFGMPMPNRNVEGDYRYKYQGQEKDKETGMEAFELRLWDSRIGRWLTTDPMGEFFSPYLGMGNNPISLIDPTGGSTDCPDCPPNTIHLEGVTVTAPRLGGGFDFSGMPDWLRFNQPDTWNTSFVGDLDEYNRAHKTNYTDGNQFNQWYFQNHYKPEYDDMISNIHSATSKAAELTMYVLPTPLAAAGSLRAVPALSRGITKADKALMAFGGKVNVKGNFYFNVAKRRSINTLSKRVQNLSYTNKRRLVKFGGNHLKNDIQHFAKHNHDVVNYQTFKATLSVSEFLNYGKHFIR